MRIHRICLENWGQHSHLELEFPPTGVISLTGPNDSGKSTLLSAIGWVLSPNARNRYGDRNDIQDGQTSAAVTLEFSLEDNLHQPTRHTLRKLIIVGENPALRANPETTIELMERFSPDPSGKNSSWQKHSWMNPASFWH